MQMPGAMGPSTLGVKKTPDQQEGPGATPMLWFSATHASGSYLSSEHVDGAGAFAPGRPASKMTGVGAASGNSAWLQLGGLMIVSDSACEKNCGLKSGSIGYGSVL